MSPLYAAVGVVKDISYLVTMYVRGIELFMSYKTSTVWWKVVDMTNGVQKPISNKKKKMKICQH